MGARFTAVRRERRRRPPSRAHDAWAAALRLEWAAVDAERLAVVEDDAPTRPACGAAGEGVLLDPASGLRSPPPKRRRQPPPRSRVDLGDEGDDGVVAALLQRCAEEDAHARGLPPGFAVREASLDDASLIALNAEFAAEDERVGELAGECHAAVGSVLEGPGGAAVAYALHYAFPAPSWDVGRAASLPPRLSHLFVTQAERGRGLGTALLCWWRDRFARRVHLFAVEDPNASMRRCLQRAGCAEAEQRSGNGASSVHFVAVQDE